MAGAKSWREVRGQRALNEARVAAYRQVMDTQELIAERLADRGISDEQIEAALAAAHPDTPQTEHEDVYLPSLTRYVAALGGHLELRAVFPEETMTILSTRQPAGTDPV